MLAAAPRVRLAKPAKDLANLGSRGQDTPMIDHLTLIVSDIDLATTQLAAALAPLDYAILRDLTRAQVPQLPVARIVGMGVAPKPDLWLRPSEGAPVQPLHLALRARTRGAVDAFYAAALAAGMTDNGPPGPRPHYHANYYGAFVLTSDGHNLEAVCHDPA